MAHKYSNFAAAYAALEARWLVARGFQVDAYDRAGDAITYANAGDWQNGIKQNAYAIMATLSAFDNLFQNYGYAYDQSVHAECLYWAGQEGGVSLGMPAILTAMYGSTSPQTMLFIVMIDAMRGSLAEKTVTSSSMADYLRHFIEQ